jgi:hypothetical protein
LEQARKSFEQIERESPDFQEVHAQLAGRKRNSRAELTNRHVTGGATNHKGTVLLRFCDVQDLITVHVFQKLSCS